MDNPSALAVLVLLMIGVRLLEDNFKHVSGQEETRDSGLYLASGIAGMMLAESRTRRSGSFAISFYGAMRDMYEGMVTLNDGPSAGRRRKTKSILD